MRLTRFLHCLLCLAIGLPMLVLVLQFAGTLLGKMGDPPGQQVLRGIAIGGAILWVMSLLGLVIVVALEIARRDEPPPGSL